MHICFLTLFLLFSSTSTYAHVDESDGHENHGSVFSAVYAFGDSYTDTGNAYLMNRLEANYVVMTHRSGGRLSNGQLEIDYLCNALSVPPLQPYQNASRNPNAPSGGMNFAIAGSTSLASSYYENEEVKPVICKGTPMSFQTQIYNFKEFLKEKDCLGKKAGRCKEEFKDALFFVGAMGVSDYYRSQGSSVSTKWITQLTVAEVTKLVQTLINAGAKYIIVEGLPPIGCLPISISLTSSNKHDKMGCGAHVNQAITIHNKILQHQLEDLRRHHRQCSILYADFWNAYVTVMMNSGKYHFAEPKKACCGPGERDPSFKLNSMCGAVGISKCKDPDKYISWDGIHLTEAMHRQIADLYVNQGFCKPAFDKMIRSKSSKY